jgi:hypothetical protein
VSASYDDRQQHKAIQTMHRRSIWLLWLVMAAAGCAGGGESQADAPDGFKRRDIASLPPVGDYLPPIDDAKLSVAPPIGWTELPRGRSFLLGLAKGKPNELPRILINAEAPPEGSPEKLTEENAAAFAEQQDAELQHAAKTGKKKVHEYHLPIVLGETVFVRHVRQASISGVACVVQSLQTIQNRRLYTVDLIVQIDTKHADDYGKALTEHRDVGYAVAAHLKFAPPEEQVNPSAETNPAEQPPTKKAD